MQLSVEALLQPVGCMLISRKLTPNFPGRGSATELGPGQQAGIASLAHSW